MTADSQRLGILLVWFTGTMTALSGMALFLQNRLFLASCAGLGLGGFYWLGLFYGAQGLLLQNSRSGVSSRWLLVLLGVKSTILFSLTAAGLWWFSSDQLGFVGGLTLAMLGLGTVLAFLHRRNERVSANLRCSLKLKSVNK